MMIDIGPTLLEAFKIVAFAHIVASGLVGFFWWARS